MAIRISDKNRREMSEERDFAQSVPVVSRYCILSSPRSGSTLLGRMLYETGLAGDPQEFLNPPLIAIERERSGNDTLDWNGFLQLMEKRRTSPNGVFGIKLHFSQMLSAFRSRQVTPGMVKMLKGFNHLIWIRRRDRLRQGISQAVGMHTQVWSSEDSNSVDLSAGDIHPFQVLRATVGVSHDDHAWEQLIPQAGLDVLVIWYEDLVDNYEAESRRVLTHLNLQEMVEDIPEPPLKRQATEVNEEIRQALLAYLGISSDDSIE